MKTEQANQLNTVPMNAVLRGNCIEVMHTMPSSSIDFVLTDPPYLVNYTSRDGRKIANDVNGDWLQPAFAEIFRVLPRNSFCVSFYGWSKADAFLQAWRNAGFYLAGHLTFPKPYASTERFLRYHHENAYLLAKGNPQQPAQPIPDVIQWRFSGNRLHPTQKPLCILTPLVASFSPVNGIVLDPFCGSGSSLVAAKMQHRSFVGIELDASYYAIARDRLGSA